MTLEVRTELKESRTSSAAVKHLGLISGRTPQKADCCSLSVFFQIITALEEDSTAQKMQLGYRLQQIAAAVENKVTDL